MGMDVYGKAPGSERGEYFRNNVWWWRPLWDYCCEVAPQLCEGVSGHFNDGDGLDADEADELARILFMEIDSGRAAEYEKRYRERVAALPREDCGLCEGTGVRTDEIGQQMGQPIRELEPAVQIITGRTRGWCNGCGGEGKRDSFEASYPFDVENVKEFAEFLKDSGGFSIC